jgi:threonylcarbamoyladenosine tRNA methylthiotransferase MtaB
VANAEVITLGCRLNTFESEVIREHSRSAGLKDTLIVNTCAVTAEAERQARQTIRRLRRDNPKSKIIVTGCAAQLHPDTFAKMSEVDRVLGNEEKLQAASYQNWETKNNKIAVADIMTVTETAAHLIHELDGRTRAFVQIQQGCDHRCTFCIIPFARGNNRSLAPGAIVSQIRELVAAGYKEVVLTGVDICSYGTDLEGKPTLGELIRRLLKMVPELPRLRLSSLDPAAMDDVLFEVLATDHRLMPHLHLSVQAMDDMVLKRMKRRHVAQGVYDVVERARSVRDDVVFGADLIAGFPTETDAQFENGLNAIGELGFAHLHVFPYSEREGTPAVNMPAVEKSVRKARAEQLRAVGEKAMSAFLAERMGTVADVLVEKDSQGLTEHYVPVHISGPDLKIVEMGDLVKVHIGALTDGRLQGTVIHE